MNTSENKIKAIKRCQYKGCNSKKLFPMRLCPVKCACSKIFCIAHNLPYQHQCVVNYFELNKDTLFKTNPTANFLKVEKI